MRSKTGTFQIHAALFFVSLLYAGNFSIAKLAMPHYIGAFGFILLRVAVAALLFNLYYYLFAYEKLREKKHYLQLLIASFFGVALNMSAFFKGLSLTSSINASVLMLFTPVFVIIFMIRAKQTRLSIRMFAGLLIAFTGAAFLMGIRDFSLSNEGLKGDLLVVLNAASYGFYLFYISKLLRLYKTSTIVAWLFLFGLIFVIPAGLPELQAVEWNSLSEAAIFAIVYVIIGITIFTFFLNSWAIQKSDPALVGTYVYLQPVLAAVIAILLGQDRLTIEKTIFAAIIIMGVYLVNKSK